ncbi:MAG TPA: 50S ribosomal protein L5 [Candidatus Eisenbacteria bacterium]|nr:50S ribosomal protein L5 [Candidatus Eisenbacteria bacterium]
MADEKKAKGEKAKGEGAKAKGEGAKPKGEGKAKPQGKEGGGKAAKAAKEGPAAGATQSARPRAPKEKPRLATFYQETVKPALMEKFKYSSSMQAPRFEKIVINMGVGDAIQDQKLLEGAVVELTQISGQKPSIRRAKKSISNFKLREGVPIGCKVTLRGSRMFEFYDRLINVAVPRIRDFRGLSPRAFDGRGNYTMGFTEQIIFPEINYDKIQKVRGMDVTIVTSARNDEEGRELLRLMRMPFRLR